jgi:hypothetical protein
MFSVTLFLEALGLAAYIADNAYTKCKFIQKTLHFPVSASRILVTADERVPERPNERLVMQQKIPKQEAESLLATFFDFNM